MPQLSEILAQDCTPDCPVRLAATVLDGKWTTQIIRDLLGGTKRFSELLRSLDGISPKVLTARLKMLEDHNIIVKTIYPVMPPKTEYALTAFGMELRPVIVALATFGVRLAGNVAAVK